MKTRNTETVEEFLARGGKITKLKTQALPKVRKQREFKSSQKDTYIDMSALPTALKIRYGIKE